MSTRRKFRIAKTFPSAKKAADEFFAQNDAFFLAVTDPVDGVKDWMDGIETKVGRSTRHVKLNKSPAGRRILGTATGAGYGEGVVRRALAYVFGQARGRKWSAVDWDQIVSLEESLAPYFDDTAFDGAAGGIAWWPLAKRAEESDSAVAAGLSGHDLEDFVGSANRKRISAILDDIDQSLSGVNCLEPWQKTLVEARVKAWRRWARDPKRTPDYACAPDIESGGLLCDYPRIEGELRAIARACTDQYDPNWARWNEGEPGFPVSDLAGPVAALPASAFIDDEAPSGACTPQGAGRILGRLAAQRRRDKAKGKKPKPPKAGPKRRPKGSARAARGLAREAASPAGAPSANTNYEIKETPEIAGTTITAYRPDGPITSRFDQVDAGGPAANGKTGPVLVEKSGKRAWFDSIASTLKAAQEGDKIEIHSKGLPRPRKVDVTSSWDDKMGAPTGSIYVGVTSGHVRPSHPSGGIITLIPSRMTVDYQPTFSQSPVQVDRVSLVSRAAPRAATKKAKPEQLSAVTVEQEGFALTHPKGTEGGAGPGQGTQATLAGVSRKVDAKKMAEIKQRELDARIARQKPSDGASPIAATPTSSEGVKLSTILDTKERRTRKHIAAALKTLITEQGLPRGFKVSARTPARSEYVSLYIGSRSATLGDKTAARTYEAVFSEIYTSHGSAEVHLIRGSFGRPETAIRSQFAARLVELVDQQYAPPPESAAPSGKTHNGTPKRCGGEWCAEIVGQPAVGDTVRIVSRRKGSWLATITEIVKTKALRGVVRTIVKTTTGSASKPVESPAAIPSAKVQSSTGVAESGNSIEIIAREAGLAVRRVQRSASSPRGALFFDVESGLPVAFASRAEALGEAKSLAKKKAAGEKLPAFSVPKSWVTPVSKAMDAREFWETIDATWQFKYARLTVQDWGSGRGQGRRRGGMVTGAMSSAPRGLKAYVSLLFSSELSREDRDVIGQNRGEMLAARALAAGLDNFDALTLALTNPGGALEPLSRAEAFKALRWGEKDAKT